MGRFRKVYFLPKSDDEVDFNHHKPRRNDETDIVLDGTRNMPTVKSF